MFIYTHVYKFPYIHVYICIHIFINIYEYMNIWIYIYLYINIYAYIYKCSCTNTNNIYKYTFTCKWCMCTYFRKQIYFLCLSFFGHPNMVHKSNDASNTYTRIQFAFFCTFHFLSILTWYFKSHQTYIHIYMYVWCDLKYHVKMLKKWKVQKKANCMRVYMFDASLLLILQITSNIHTCMYALMRVYV